MQMYVANCSHQNHTINYRLPGSDKIVQLDVGMGRQIPLASRDGFDSLEVEAVVKQLSIYGMIDVKDANRAEGVVPLVYSIDKQVPSDAMTKIIHHNRGVMSSQGARRRKESAIAAIGAMDTEESPIKKLEMSIEEASSGSMPVAEGDKPIGEGFKYDADQTPGGENKPKRPSRRVQA